MYSQDRKKFLYEILNKGTVVLMPNDDTFKNLYSTQNWIEGSSIVDTFKFFNFAFASNILKPGEIFTIEKQREAFLRYYSSGNYDAPTLIPFDRIDSKNNHILCFVIFGGHHRINIARTFNIPIEVDLDVNSGVIEIGNARSLRELNEIMSEKTLKKVGGEDNHINFNRWVYSQITLYLARMEQ